MATEKLSIVERLETLIGTVPPSAAKRPRSAREVVASAYHVLVRLRSEGFTDADLAEFMTANDAPIKASTLKVYLGELRRQGLPAPPASPVKGHENEQHAPNCSVAVPDAEIPETSPYFTPPTPGLVARLKAEHAARSAVPVANVSDTAGTASPRLGMGKVVEGAIGAQGIGVDAIFVAGGDQSTNDTALIAEGGQAISDA